MTSESLKEAVARIVDDAAFRCDLEVIATTQFGSASERHLALARRVAAARQAKALSTAEAIISQHIAPALQRAERAEQERDEADSEARHYNKVAEHEEDRRRGEEAEITRLKALLGEVEICAGDTLLLADAIGTQVDMEDGPCPTEGLCGEPLCHQAGCLKDKADRARALLSTLRNSGGGDE